ncbi:O-succinylbenzoic acid--CoA ligase (OSB-CoA synthetase) [Synechococcus sp. SYN20]|uniref:AMP-binding protein n=1 Tax=Synechococcus sp. SYN20 TaxID=1050714 RepID=UPI00164597E6|nr:AMP-binding protein [Synechococcus sp. SYN20]QNJ27454.1 O-succinylbenzoic acid--CoA ligase (OSB-CoA synthetase) [Synechococcus sp. SYN20]
MSSLEQLRCDSQSPSTLAGSLLPALERGNWVRLLGPQDVLLEAPKALPEGPGLVLSTGGSSGGRQLCLQPSMHLDRSAAATGRWLQALGLNASQVIVWNPLPFQHVSGLMPWWRAQQWNVAHVWLSPALMKSPQALLAESCHRSDWDSMPMVISLVPTQLGRLLADSAGVRWLQAMALIWVGGAALPDELAARARALGIKLAPCYGSTETAAMVVAQSPERFLNGEEGVGEPLDDIELRVEANGALAVRCRRLAIGRWKPDGDGSLAEQSTEPSVSPLTGVDGWWSSGDAARLKGSAETPQLTLLGRLDGAIHSGGVTVFPEQLEVRLMAAAREVGLPLKAVLLLGVHDPEWGERLVALVRWQDAAHLPGAADAFLLRLKALTDRWLPAERPQRWHHCAELASTNAGKWERARWRAWLKDLERSDGADC